MLSNPLLRRGADPSICSHNGWLYYTQTTFRNIALWKVRQIGDLREARRRIIWRPKPDSSCAHNIWAPELHRLGGRWYIYFAADDGHNRNHRLYVLECRAEDPARGPWEFAGQLRTPGDRWAIDGTVLRYNRQSYLLWSGWHADENGQQNIYIARMADPLTVEGERVAISSPEHPWELHGTIKRPGPDDKGFVAVNEGPAALVRNGKVFVTYSASGSWTEHYCVGLLTAECGADLMDAASWRKQPEPVFTAVGAAPNGTCAAGHNSFFRDPADSTDWILYHANDGTGKGWGNRSPRAQPFTWNAAGDPEFGVPLPSGISKTDTSATVRRSYPEDASDGGLYGD